MSNLKPGPGRLVSFTSFRPPDERIPNTQNDDDYTWPRTFSGTIRVGEPKDVTVRYIPRKEDDTPPDDSTT